MALVGVAMTRPRCRFPQAARYGASVLAVLALAMPARARVASGGQTQNEIIERQILPHLDDLFRKLIAEKRDITIDGTKAFSGDDRFLPGKVALGLCYLLINTPRSDPNFATYLEGYREIADLTVEDVNETWGIYYYMSALNKLRKAGLLDKAIRPATLQKLRGKLDWRPFVKVPEFTLVKLPTNYYGVAFSIARLRMLMGWEDPSSSQRLLEQIVNHYQQYSGEYGFSDETDGAGRFDRYSVLLIGEICERLIETDLEVTPQLKQWLRKSADLILVNLNARGDGFSYGRSIGAYADTSFLEVLSAAAYFDVLTDTEKDTAYAFATRATRKYADFWYDPQMHSVNMWEKGRATDAYRGKARILGENFSLSDQLIKTNDVWNRLGYKNRLPSHEFDAWLARLPKTTLTWFAKGEYDRALVTYRDGAHVISIPLVNGGPSYHARNAYFPIPYSTRMIDGSPDAGYPQLVPRFSLADGSELMPLVYIRGVALEKDVLRYSQDGLDRIGANLPVKDDRLKVNVRYQLSPGSIQRVDTYVPSSPLDIKRISWEFASFSEDARVEGTHVRFGRGDVHELKIQGLQHCQAEALIESEVYRAPHGAMKTRISCSTENVTLDKPFTISWTLRYR
jgi:hypothetical protein